MNVSNLEEFRAAFDRAFARPALQTDRAKDLWIDLLTTSEALEGPLYSIKEKGHCDWVFRPYRDRFFIASPAEFGRWANELVEQYSASLVLDAPVTPDELADLHRLKEQTAARRALVDYAVQL